MEETLLKEYFKLLVEKIRSKQFNIKEFQLLKTQKQVMNYAKAHLQFLGDGSSRVVFVLNSRKVLKVANGQKGIAQNEVEVDAFTNPRSKKVIAKIFEVDPQYKWVISELVKPLTDVDEFESLTGMSFVTMIEFLKNKRVHATTSPAVPGLKNSQHGETAIDQRFVDSVMSFIQENKMLIGDILRLDSWGKTADGRVVLFDYGATNEVFQKFYQKNFWKALNAQHSKTATSQSNNATVS